MTLSTTNTARLIDSPLGAACKEHVEAEHLREIVAECVAGALADVERKLAELRALVEQPATTTRYSVQQVAARYGVHPMTVRVWLRQGRLGCTKLGRIVITEADCIDMERRYSRKAGRRA